MLNIGPGVLENREEEILTQPGGVSRDFPGCDSRVSRMTSYSGGHLR